MGLFWLKHPRTKQPDTMLTIATYSSAASIFKFLTNGAEIHFGTTVLHLGTIDAGIISALLAPTLTSYVARKWKDSPDKVTPDGPTKTDSN
jgi:hypothetical protein